tara:strand:- start:692 stop:1405 length:714 start_codon:yes stop_codon:yes gene_type:complete
MSFETHTIIKNNLIHVLKKIESYSNQYQREQGEVQLLAVSKTKPISDLKAAYENGIRSFGENYLQDTLPKIEALPQDIAWHFIGAIQSNKTKSIAENFAWVHTISNSKIAERLNRQRPENLTPLNICLQININHEPDKAGIDINDSQTLIQLIQTIEQLPLLKLRGLMCIPEATQDFDLQCENFRRLKTHFNHLNQTLNLDMDTLSMGMSGDLEAAIKEGSTMVRIGTDIFGKRAQA